MADNLSTPLGKKKRKKSGFMPVFSSVQWPVGRILFAIIALLVTTIVIRIIVIDDPMGGQPLVEVPISSTRDSNVIAQHLSNGGNNQTPTQTSEPDNSVITIITDSQTSSGTDINERNEFGVFLNLTEQTQHGPIPRISPDGRIPFKTYARPSISASNAGTPLIAIIVTGMGLSESGTLDAISTLPDNITLAFAPYGRTLERTTAAARAGGHELMLEIPMEPFDYPNSDPGPHTLLTGHPPRANLDRLFWLMSRIGGYVAVINNMGARFTASATDLSPFMEELGTRGIGYLDDGSSNRSLSRQLALANQVPFARANMLLDSNPSRAAILTQLQALEDLARQDGHAVGIISALPVSISTLTSWAAQLEEKDIELVPASVIMDN